MIKKMKKKLSTLKSTSRRVRFTGQFWNHPDDHKACFFYWVMIPTSMLGYIFIGICLFGYFVVGGIGGFLIGRPLNLKGFKENGPDKGFHEYRYNVLTKRTNKFFAPWMLLIPASLISLVWLLVVHNTLWIAGEIILFIMAAAVVVGIFGWLATRHKDKLKAGWNKICPELEVISDAD